MDIKFITFIYISLISLQVISAKFDSNRFERKLIALTKVLKFMIERPEQMNLDTTFGVTFAEAHTQSALQHKNAIHLDTYQRNILKNIVKLCEETRNTLHAKEKLPNKDLIEFSSKINRPEIWIKPIIWKKINSEEKFLPNPDLTLKSTFDGLFTGHPQEEESDYCLVNLAHHCHFSSKCRDLIIHNESSTTGYPLTHKLLMLQVLSAFQCETDINNFLPYLKFKFCSQILQDLINNEAMGFPSVSKDLASEQVFLCGMEGYLDFLDRHYEQLILDWQHPSGCYSGIGNLSHQYWGKTRVRRSGTFTDFGCVNHATGLGAATLALMIRKDIEMLMNHEQI